jgi:SAM-dependent methyltransferase
MNKLTRQSQSMYNDYRFGNFNYAEHDVQVEPLLGKFLMLVKKEHSLYDIGCGAGFWLNAYLKAGISKDSITLLDLAPVNVEELARHGFRSLCGSVLELPFENSVSDFTICNGVIHHTFDPYRAFAELVRITKPGGRIYLNVYNIWHPYFYIVHKATFGIRYIYWNITKKVADVVFPVAKLVFAALAYITLRVRLDDKTAKIIFMDQVITPRASLFSKRKIEKYARKSGCEVEELRYNRNHIMIAAFIRVDKDAGKQSVRSDV